MGRSGGAPSFGRELPRFDVSIVDPTAVSRSGTGACGESHLNPNAGTRSAEKTKTDKYILLCHQLGMDFVPNLLPSIFTATGGMGEQFQRQHWNPHWSRVAAEDEAMNIGAWVARKRKATWQARFAVEIAKCDARIILHGQSPTAHWHVLSTEFQSQVSLGIAALYKYRPAPGSSRMHIPTLTGM